MGTDIVERLTTEIENCRRLRHELVMRKFAFLTAFAGLGSIEKILLPGELSVSKLIYLLYLVPFVAVAFDTYIFLEDYRIKRAGEFLKRLPKLERWQYDVRWQEFVALYPNKGSTMRFRLLPRFSSLHRFFFWIISKNPVTGSSVCLLSP